MTTTFQIDTTHSSVEFSIRHLMIAKVRGRFTQFTGTLELEDGDLTRSTVKAEIDAASITTANDQRDTHLRSADFFDVAAFPQITFVSKQIVEKNGELVLNGALTIHGVTNDVTLAVENLGTAADPWGNQRIAFAARGSIDRKQFGLNWNQVLEAGGFLVGDKVELSLDVQAVRAAAAVAA
jgi:polyisoprenoid-binding protein YceI